MASPPLHADIAPLAFLLGTWTGEGAGEYPTIAPFRYGEQVRFGHVGKPFLAYSQRTWSLDDGRPFHAESGYWRHVGDGRVELVLAHPTGVTEIQHGLLRERSLRLASVAMGLTPTAKRVDALERDIDIDGDRLAYAVRMAAVGQALTHHLAAVLVKD